MTWLIGSLMILAVFAWHQVHGIPLSERLGVPRTFDAFGLGLSSTFSIFGFRTFYWGDDNMVTLPVFVKIVGGFQTAFGFVFLFFLGLGLRNRFRLK